MEPVRVKLYGLFPVTKRRYVKQLSATVVLLLMLLGVWFLLPAVEMPRAPREELPAYFEWVVWLLHKLPWIVGSLAVLVFAEATIILRRFTRLEALRQCANPPPLNNLSECNG